MAQIAQKTAASACIPKLDGQPTSYHAQRVSRRSGLVESQGRVASKPPDLLPARHAVPGPASLVRDATATLADFVHRSLMSEPGLMNRWGTRSLCGVSILLLAGGFMSSGAARQQAAPPSLAGGLERARSDRSVRGSVLRRLP